MVEDMPSVRRLTCTMLERHGYHVLAAENAQDALGIMERHERSIDLVLTDLVMPGMHGGELYRRLSAIQPHLKGLFMSAYADPAVASCRPKEDGLAFIQKPFSLDALARKVREVLGPVTPAREPAYASVGSSA